MVVVDKLVPPFATVRVPATSAVAKSTASVVEPEPLNIDAVSVSETIASVTELAGNDKVPPLDKVKAVPNIAVPDIFKLPVCWVPGVEPCNDT